MYKRQVFDGVLVVDKIERLEDVADHVVTRGGGLRLAQVPDEPAAISSACFSSRTLM